MIHKVWFIEISPSHVDSWFPGHLVCGSNPLRSGFLERFRDHCHLDNDEVRVKRVQTILEFQRILNVISPGSIMPGGLITGMSFTEFSVDPINGEKLQFDDGHFTFGDGLWAECDTK